MLETEIRELLAELAGDDGTSAASADHLAAEARRHIPAKLLADWQRQCRALAGAGLSTGTRWGYVRHSLVVAEQLGAQAAFQLAESVRQIAYIAGRRAAQALPHAAAAAVRRLGTPGAFRLWLNTVERYAPQMPDVLAALLEHTDRVLGQVGIAGYEAWVLNGLRASGGDRARRHAYFTFSDPDAERALMREAGEIVYADLDRRLTTYLTALWRLRLMVRAVGGSPGRPLPRRASFDGGVVWVPETLPGVPAAAAVDLFRASLAHVAAHAMFSGDRFAVGGLKPLQIALVSLIEDARVELLALQAFPGLRRLWLPFHEARPGGAVTAPTLMARLARALIDPDYRDGDAWVDKGRAMLFARRVSLHDPTISRGIGNLLGNDLGQMRVQFNARSYIVEPAYRDDNLGLWDFGDDRSDNAEGTDIFDLVRIAPQTGDDTRPDPCRQEQAPEEAVNRARPADAAAQEEGVPVARYPEWDYVIARERRDWATVVEYAPVPGAAFTIEQFLKRRSDVVNRITALVRSARVSRPVRVRRRLDGDRLDIDAAIEAMISRSAGETPDPRIYMTSERRHRDLSVLLLLDISESTNDRVHEDGATVLDLERQSTALLAHAMAELGDLFAIHAFCSNGRNEVRYQRLKDFATPYDNQVKANLAGLTAGLSTRIGIALRHAAADLRRQPTLRKVVLVITDGEPSDIDVQERRYLVEDARKAVITLNHEGIDVFCVGLQSDGDRYLTRIFGRRNAVQVDRLELLPEKLPLLYFRLTS